MWNYDKETETLEIPGPQFRKLQTLIGEPISTIGRAITESSFSEGFEPRKWLVLLDPASKDKLILVWCGTIKPKDRQNVICSVIHPERYYTQGQWDEITMRAAKGIVLASDDYVRDYFKKELEPSTNQQRRKMNNATLI